MKNVKRPSFWLFITEVFRALWELWKVRPFIKNYKVEKKVDGHSILVVPGLLASDYSTQPLRRFLNKLGYKSYGWEMGTNLGNLAQITDLEQKIDQLYAQSGQKISLIGWSLGGIYARELAKRKEEKVCQVITLGSPFAGVNQSNNATVTFNFLKWYKGFPEPDEALLKSLEQPTPQPITAIYSKKDGIVPWQACKEVVEDDVHNSIEVHSSHLGMGACIEVLEIIRERLANFKYQYAKSDSIESY